MCSSSADERRVLPLGRRGRALFGHRGHAGTVTNCVGSNAGGSAVVVDEQALDAVDRQPHPLRARRHVTELERERRRRRRMRLDRRARRLPSDSVASCAGRSVGYDVDRHCHSAAWSRRGRARPSATWGSGASSIAVDVRRPRVRLVRADQRDAHEVDARGPVLRPWCRPWEASGRSRSCRCSLGIVSSFGSSRSRCPNRTTSDVPSRWWPARRTGSPSRAAGCDASGSIVDDRRVRRQEARLDDDAAVAAGGEIDRPARRTGSGLRDGLRASISTTETT